jgi:hypothetical protein
MRNKVIQGRRKGVDKETEFSKYQGCEDISGMYILIFVA